MSASAPGTATDSEARRWSQHWVRVIEESIKISQRHARKHVPEVRRTFEPTRLSARWLAEAYEQLVSRRVRIVPVTTTTQEEQSCRDQQQSIQ